MKIKIIEQYGSWDSVKRAALKTQNLKPKNPPTEQWKKQMCLAEHSPIRLLAWSIQIDEIENFIQTHLARHHVGIEKFISSMRNDITGIEGVNITRETLNNMEIYVNLQALISISRKRLCNKSHIKTRQVWQEVINKVAEIHPVIKQVCQRECIYRNGFCPEIKKCGYINTELFKIDLSNYLK